jgi:cobalt-precorrin-5B (C1)-methyltransferase
VKQLRRRGLRQGFTTGAAAAAAAQAALHLLLEGSAPAAVRIRLLDGEPIAIAVQGAQLEAQRTACATVIKDGGDDPDVTHGAQIGARVALLREGPPGTIRITGGPGVGRVTLPGLELPPGEPAINPGPRRMIREALEALTAPLQTRPALAVEVFVPRGEEIARKTLNGRLGILGGISILGTTGRVNPLSHTAWTATIDAALAVARAQGLERAILTTGRRSERQARLRWPRLPEQAFVQMGDHLAHSLESARRLGFAAAHLALFFGKAVKVAQGAGQTHAARVPLDLSWLAAQARAVGLGAPLVEAIAAANTARQALGILRTEGPALIARVGEEMLHAARGFAGPSLAVEGTIFPFEGGDPLFESKAAEGAP